MGKVSERLEARLSTPVEVLMREGSMPPILQPSTPLEKRVGRPSAYRSEFCDLVVEMAHQGHSFGGFAGRIGIARSKVAQWMRVHPEFGDACARAAAGRLYFWESIAIHVGQTGGDGSQGQMAIFHLINAARCVDNLDSLDYVDKRELQVSQTLTLSSVVERMMAKLDEIAKAKRGDDAKVIEQVQEPAADNDGDVWS